MSDEKSECPKCGKLKFSRHLAYVCIDKKTGKKLKVCNVCFYKDCDKKEVCCICGKNRKAKKHIPEGPVCQDCYYYKI